MDPIVEHLSKDPGREKLPEGAAELHHYCPSCGKWRVMESDDNYGYLLVCTCGIDPEPITIVI